MQPFRGAYCLKRANMIVLQLDHLLPHFLMQQLHIASTGKADISERL
ncbi:MAG: hypothetical protein ACXV7J_15540 [Methylomonas sp.]